MSLLLALITIPGLIGGLLTLALWHYGKRYEKRIRGSNSVAVLGIGADYHEAICTYRHYSNLRFVMLPIFATLTGALLSPILGDQPEIKGTLIRYIPTIGVWLTVVFLSLEIALDIIMTKVALFISNAMPYSHMQRDDFTKTIQACTRFPILALFAVAVWLWLKIAESQGSCVVETFFPT